MFIHSTVLEGGEGHTFSYERLTDGMHGLLPYLWMCVSEDLVYLWSSWADLSLCSSIGIGLCVSPVVYAAQTYRTVIWNLSQIGQILVFLNHASFFEDKIFTDWIYIYFM